MSMLEVTKVEALPLDKDLLGFAIESPSPDDTYPGYIMGVAGWALPRDGALQGIELMRSGARISLTPPNRHRPDIDARFRHSPASVSCGFRTMTSVLGFPSEFEMVIRAVDSNERRIPLARIGARRSPLSSRFTPGIQPIMLSNIGRSGSTWVTHLLGHHPEIVSFHPFKHEPRVAAYWVGVLGALSDPRSFYQAIAPQIHRGLSAGFDRLWWTGHQRFAPPPDLSHDESLQRWLTSDAIEELASFCQSRIEVFYQQVSTLQGKHHLRYFIERCNGTGGMTPTLIWELYPKAREIFLVRDFRDVFCSMAAFNQKVGRALFGRDNEVTDEEYIRFHLGRQLEGLLAMWNERRERAFLLRYEDLILEPQQTLSRLFGYLDVESGAEVAKETLRRASQSSADSQKSHKTSQEAQASIGRWRVDLAPPLQSAFEESLSHVLAGFGYSPGASRG